jgi:ribosome biogenesis GTPase
MEPVPGKKASKGGEKVRVPFRRNRSSRARPKDWTGHIDPAGGQSAAQGESIVPKGDLSRKRTIIVGGDEAAQRGLRRGTVVAVRGLFADVDDGSRIWPCTIRRILRTRLIQDRSPVTVGDQVNISTGDGADETAEGAIESIEPRRGMLQRLTGKRRHTIVANVDQAIIVSSAGEPDPKPHLIDRYIVALLSGQIHPVVCMNKIDLSPDRQAASILDRYAALGYHTLCTSAATGEGIAELRAVLKDKSSVVAGQSGVGKSSLLNAVQPGLELKTGDIIEQTQKGRHTTTTARLLRLDHGGYVVDTPGIRTLDVSIVPGFELEAYFVEFVDRVRHCKFRDCTHTHETGCAIKGAVEAGEIHPDRYASYVELFEETAKSPYR